jgi:hypothetical protein
MPNIKRANASSITKSGVAIADVPDAPTIGAVADTAAGGTVTVAYTAAVTGGTATTFTATSSPGGVTGTGSSPINVTGLTDGTAYTFTVTASNTTGSATSAASASVTPSTWLTGAYDSIATITVGAGGNSSCLEFARTVFWKCKNFYEVKNKLLTCNILEYIESKWRNCVSYNLHLITCVSTVVLSVLRHESRRSTFCSIIHRF